MTVHHIVPPYLLEHLERTADDPNLRARYRLTLQHDAVLRSRPAALGQGSVQLDGIVPSEGTVQSEGTAQLEGDGAGARRVVHDAENGTTLPGPVVRREGEPAVADATVNQAYDGTGATWTMFKECFGRDSVDGAGLPLSSTVYYDHGYANAFWDGAQLVFGDGDGEIFGDFTGSIDVVGHELTHGVTQYTAGLVYEGQSGALNESLSDVFGSLAKQHHLGQTAAEADWLIGADLFRPGVSATALRSMKAPGTAYDDPRLGRDPQPAHMSGYVETTEDNGGVHLNSGIPNHAFYLVATALPGNAYDHAGQIWYTTLTSGNLTPTTTFASFATATHTTAITLYGPTSPEATAVQTAWQNVGVLPTTPQPEAAPTPPESEPDPAPPEPTDLIRAANTSLPLNPPPAAPPPPTNPPPSDAAPTDAAPTDAAPTDAAPTDAAPTDAAPTNAAPTNAAPTDAAPPPPAGPTPAPDPA
ncbi:M4 family metallopeptidase [Kribbella sp. NPDC051620]|uniref:M4 family metallopeptidase n=1 Tax=Kribbella sp. NPDC051620 TaxID=3364120 RepID=UPI0037A7F3F7